MPRLSNLPHCGKEENKSSARADLSGSPLKAGFDDRDCVMPVSLRVQVGSKLGQGSLDPVSNLPGRAALAPGRILIG